MKKPLTLLASSVLMLGCSSNPYMSDYLDTMEIPDAYIYFEHDEYGLQHNQHERLKPEFERCNVEVFGSKRFELAGNMLNDIATLERISKDYHAYLLESVMFSGGSEQEAFRNLYAKADVDPANAELRRNAFGYTEGLEKPLKALTRLILKRDKCLAASGWLYKRIRY